MENKPLIDLEGTEILGNRADYEKKKETSPFGNVQNVGAKVLFH